MCEKTDKQVRFDRAWKNAQELMKFGDLELSMLLAQMAIQAEVFAEMSNESDFENDIDANGLFEVATECMEDIYSKANMEWFKKEFAEQLKAFGVKRTVSYEPKLPK